jgi:hypothetical protein
MATQSFAKHLKDALEAAGLSQFDLAAQGSAPRHAG